MSASTTDKITDTFNAANPNVAKVTSTRAASGATLACDNLAGWPTASKVHFSTYQVDTAGDYVEGTQIDWSGIVTSSTSIGSMTRLAGATDNGSAVGDYVEMNPTAKWAQDLADALTAEHSRTGVHALTSNSTITSSKVITSLNDTNGNELVKVTATGSAVNEVTLANAATGNTPTITASGDDSNIDVKVAAKGTGVYKVGGVKRQDNTTDSTKDNVLFQYGYGVFTVGAASVKTETVTFPKAFASTPIVLIAPGGDDTAGSTSLGQGGTEEKNFCTTASQVTTTSFTARAFDPGGTNWSAGTTVFYHWVAFGEVA